MCTKCNLPETMQHILFNCNANQCKVIWKITKDICNHKNIPWPPTLDITTIMAIPLLKIHSPDGHICSGATCLFLITLSKCTFLAWKIRCTRILDHPPEEPKKTISPQEAHNQTLAIVDSRLSQDKLLTSRRRYSKRCSQKT